MKNISILFITLLMAHTARSGDPLVLPFPLDLNTLESHGIVPDQDLFLKLEYRIKPKGDILFSEDAERVWWLGTRPMMMLGSSGMPIPKDLTSRVSCYLTVYLDDDVLCEDVLIHPRKGAVPVQASPELLARSLSSAVSMDVTYLAEIANYLAGNLTSVSITASSYSIDGFGPVIDSAGNWTGAGPWRAIYLNEVRTAKTHVGIGINPSTWNTTSMGLTIAHDTEPRITFTEPNLDHYFGYINTNTDGMGFSIPSMPGEDRHFEFDIGLSTKMKINFYGITLGEYVSDSNTLEKDLLVQNYLEDVEVEIQSTSGKAELIMDGTSGNSELQFQVNGTYKCALGYNSTSDYLYLYQGGNVVLKNGNLGVGTLTPNGKLDVDGTIYQRGGVIHADYVFEDNYQLESIEDHASFMWREKHLPAITKATRDEEGREVVEVGAHRRGIVEELEKAHIYIESTGKENESVTSVKSRF